MLKWQDIKHRIIPMNYTVFSSNNRNYDNFDSIYFLIGNAAW